MLTLLTPAQIDQKIKRMAYEIYENHFQEKEMIFAGIVGSGYALAQQLQKNFVEISNMKSTLLEVILDKFQLVQTDVLLNIDAQSLSEKVVILVDDVLNTGRTLAYSLKPFLKINIKKIEIAVLVDRNYQNFPMKANFIGYSLATTLKDHIKVVLEGDEKGVYLGKSEMM